MIFFRVSIIVSPGLESHPSKLSYTLDAEIWTPNEVVDEKVGGGSLKIVAINHKILSESHSGLACDTTVIDTGYQRGQKV